MYYISGLYSGDDEITMVYNRIFSVSEASFAYPSIFGRCIIDDDLELYRFELYDLSSYITVGFDTLYKLCDNCEIFGRWSGRAFGTMTLEEGYCTLVKYLDIKWIGDLDDAITDIKNGCEVSCVDNFININDIKFKIVGIDTNKFKVLFSKLKLLGRL